MLPADGVMTMTLDEARERLGAGVVYHTPFTDMDNEHGFITGVSSVYVFVRFVGDNHPKATDPADLVFLSGSPS